MRGGTRVFRGSKKRVARIRMRDHFSIAFWCFVVVMALFFLVGFPWLLKHPGHHIHEYREHRTDSSGTTSDSGHAP